MTNSYHKPTELPRFVQDLIGSPPAAGTGVHSWLFRVARQLHVHRSEPEIADLLRAACYGVGRNVPESEIAAAVRNSKDCAWRPRGGTVWRPAPVAKWPLPELETIEAITSDPDAPALVDLWELSPWRIEDNQQHTEALVDWLFPGNPLLCVGASSAEFATAHREEWRGQLAQYQLIVPSPMSAVTGITKDGRESQHCLNNTGPRRYLVVEFDQGTVDEHAALLWHLAERAPMTMAVHSGNKSLHGWFYCAGQTEERLEKFMRYAVSISADRATWTRSQFVRMPDGSRDSGQRQTVFYFAPATIKP